MDVLNDAPGPRGWTSRANVVFAVEARCSAPPGRVGPRSSAPSRRSARSPMPPARRIRSPGTVSALRRRPHPHAPVEYADTASSLGKAPVSRPPRLRSRRARRRRVPRSGAIVDQAEQSTCTGRRVIGVAVAMAVPDVVFLLFAGAGPHAHSSSLIALAGGLLLLRFASAVFDFPASRPRSGSFFSALFPHALLIGRGAIREQLASGDSVEHLCALRTRLLPASAVAAGPIVVVAVTGLLATGIPFWGRWGSAPRNHQLHGRGGRDLCPFIVGRRPRQPGRWTRARARNSLRFARWAGMIMLRLSIVGGLVLVLLAGSFASLRLGQPEPPATDRAVVDYLLSPYDGSPNPPGFNGPLVVAATTAAYLERVHQAVGGRPRRRLRLAAPQPSPGGDAAVLNVIPAKSSPQDSERSRPPAPRRRAPRAPRAAPRSTSTSAAPPRRSRTWPTRSPAGLPIFIAIVVGLSVLLLMAVFRSLWVPLVSAAFNLLSIAAAYGVVVARLPARRLSRWRRQVPIVSFVPLFMFAILFGLSMDYNVFLQSAHPRGVHARRGAASRASCGRWRASARSSSPPA